MAAVRNGLALTLFTLLILLQSIAMPAQTPAQAGAVVAQRLPVRRVVLYKSGVGYFEHVGRVRGNQTIAIDFTSAQLDDALKSLTTLDLDGGRVTGVSYNSVAGIERRLGGLRLPLGQQATRAQLLTALRGARLEVGGSVPRETGRLLSVERVERRRDNVVSTVETITLVSDAGRMQTVALDPGVTVQIAEADLNDEVGRYLALVASQRDQDLRRVTLSTAGTGDRDLFVSYVSEVPVWKATYRIVLPGAGDERKPLLQGWAIVDNTVGEDWENVELSLVAGAPQSFVQPISRPYYVHRPVVAIADRFLAAPQTHQAGLTGSALSASIAGTVRDSGGAAIPGATVKMSRNGFAVAEVVTDSRGQYRATGLAAGAYDLSAMLSGFKTATRSNVTAAAGREIEVNLTLNVGSMTETITVTSSSSLLSANTTTVSGLPGGMNMTLDGVTGVRVDAARAALQIEAEAAQLGDLFEYKLKERVTIRKNQSALVPILGADVVAEKVSLWNPINGGRAVRALWLTNATGLTLDGGSFSVIEGQAFAGEGLMQPVKAGERRLVSYATDLGLHLASTSEERPSPVMRVRIARGVMMTTVEECQSRTYIVRNEDTEARALVIEHPVREGWTVGGTLKPEESTAAFHRFRVAIAPKTTVTLVVEETHPLSFEAAVAEIGGDQIALMVRDKALSPALEASLREVVRRQAALSALNGEINMRDTEIEQIDDSQERVRENMKALKGSADERQLLQRYVRQLDAQETRIETLRKEAQTIAGQRDKAQAELAVFIQGISG